MTNKFILSVVFVLAILIRLVFVPNPGFEADVAFWKGWGLASADKGVVWSMLNTNNNYPTPFAYTLGAMVVAYRILGGNPHNFDDYWSNTNVRFLFASKLPAIIADVGIALLILWLGKKLLPEAISKKTHHQTFLITLSALYLFSPVSIMDGAWWGQVDSVGVVFFLLSFAALVHKKIFLSGFIFMLAMMTKLQNMIYGPFLFVFIWNEYGFKNMLKALAGATVGFFFLNIEFFLSRNMGRVINSLVDNYDYFPYMSLHAYNLWWIVSGGAGMQMSDKTMILGVLYAKTVGTMIFASFYLLAILHLVIPTMQIMLHPAAKKRNTQDSSLKFFLGLSIINAAFFLFQTQSHDRYAYPLSVFLLFLAPFLSHIKRRFFLIGYILWSIVYFLNLHGAFGANYPNNVWSSLMFLIAPGPSIFLSAVLILLFGLFILLFYRTLSILAITLSLTVFFGMIGMGNLGFLTKKPLYLSSAPPWYSKQEYGQRVTNMPVNAGGSDPKKWAFLSDQYAFYRRGIGTHANSQITWDIGKKFQELHTDYGIDTTAGTGASAIFEVWGDGRLLFQSQKMGRFDLPKHTRVNIEGIKNLTLITRDAGDGNRDDHTDWLNTKLIP